MDPLRAEFETAAEQRFIDQIALRLDGGGTAWLDELSLREAAGGAELLWEATIRDPIRGFYNPTDCFILDQLVEAAERKGLYLQLCLVTRDLYMSSLKDEQSGEYAAGDSRREKTVALFRCPLGLFDPRGRLGVFQRDRSPPADGPVL